MPTSDAPVFALVADVWFWKRKYYFEEIALKVLRLKQLKSQKTKLAAEYEITRLIQHFGHLPIRDIDEALWIDHLVAERAKKRRTFYDDRKYMRMIMLHAFREGIIEKKVELPIPDLPSRAGRELRRAEIDLLLNHAGDELKFQIEIAWKMGLRLREMMHLRWDQFDWARQTILFLVTDTKTRRSREIPINPDLLFSFQKRRSEASSPFVFPSICDPTRPQFDNKTAWRRCKREAGVKARFHDLRHTCASAMLRGGAPREAVRAYLGMSEQVLLTIYAHLNLDDLRVAAEVMSEEE